MVSCGHSALSARRRLTLAASSVAAGASATAGVSSCDVDAATVSAYIRTYCCQPTPPQLTLTASTAGVVSATGAATVSVGADIVLCVCVGCEA